MVAYTGIQGQNILIVSSDPANPTEGQIWYNSTTNLLKGYANVVTNAWASGGTMTNARYGAAGFGTQTAALVAGGINGPTYKPETELYNGTSWTANPTGLNTAPRFGMAGFGTNTAGIVAGGDTYPSPVRESAATESFNGTSWTTVNSLNTARGNVNGAGAAPQTAGLVFGGNGITNGSHEVSLGINLKCRKPRQIRNISCPSF